MLEQMLGKRAAAQLAAALKIIVVCLVVIAITSVVIAVASLIAIT